MGVKVEHSIQGCYTLLGLTKDRVFTSCEKEYYHPDFPLDEDIKPYLFPLSSMTEEQRMELNSLLPVGVSLQINSNIFTYFEINTDLVCCFHIEFWDKFFDWLYKHHIDFRGLIEKSLALDATNLNIY